MTVTLLDDTPYVYLGPSDNIALDQPRVAIELFEDEAGVRSVGPSFFNTVLLDTGANSVLAFGQAVADMLEPPYPFQTEGTFEEEGVAGTEHFDISASYRFDFAGTSGVRSTLLGTRILASDQDISMFGPWGIVGMPAMAGRVTSLDMTVWTGDDFAYMEVDFSDAVPPDDGERFSVVVDNRLTWDPEPNVTSGDYPPVWADIPFLTGTAMQDGVAQEGTFLLDTGAQLSVLPANMAMGIGLDSNGDLLLDENDDNFARYETVGGIGGQITAPVFLFDEFHVPTVQGPDLVWTDLQCLVLDIAGGQFGVFGCEALTSGWIEPYFGLSSEPGYFEQVHFDFRNFELHPAGGGPSTQTGLIHFDLNPNVSQVTDPGVPGALIVESDRYTMATESGMNDIYQVVLTQEPAANVTITLSNPEGELTAVDDVHPANDFLVFTPINWNVPQTVRVTAVNDGELEGFHRSSVFHTSSSSDPGYQDVDIRRVLTNIVDLDTAGVMLLPNNDSTDVAEGGITDTYQVVLTGQPGSNLTVELRNSYGQVTAVDAENPGNDFLVFTPSNWETPQTVLVTAVDDALTEGPHHTRIMHRLDTADFDYQMTYVFPKPVNITDNDTGLGLRVIGTTPELTGELPPLSTFDVTFNKPIDEATFTTRDVGLIDLPGLAEPDGITRLGGYDTPDYAYDVQVVGDRAYVADNDTGLEILNISNPAAVTRLGGYDTPGYARAVQVVGDLAYVADYHRGLRILNVSDPADVTELGTSDEVESTLDVHVVGDRAYMANAAYGLRILDVSDPTNVTKLGEYDTPDVAQCVQVVGSVAYVADRYTGLEILNVSDPGSVTRVGGYATPSYASGVQVVGNLAFVADYSSGLHVLNVSDPANVTWVGGYDPPAGGTNGVQVIGSLAYLAQGNSGLIVLDVSDPTDVTYLGQYNTLGTSRAVHALGGRAYVADSTAGVEILQLGSPVASVAHVAGNTYRVDLGGTLPGSGDFALLLGPDILDTAGAAVDQDQDGTPGEVSEDVYVARFQIDPAPEVVSLLPADSATGVVPDTNLVITFSEDVQKGTGSVLIKLATSGTVVQTIDVGSAAVTVAGAVATINPPTDLAESTWYSVEVSAGAFEDLLGSGFAGISAPGAWDFTTGDFTNPTALSLLPAADATGVAPDTNLVITFSEDVQKGTGNVLIRRSSDGTIWQTIDVASGPVSVVGAVATINPFGAMAESNGFYVEVPAGAFEDLAGNDFAGISGATAWNFTIGDFTAPTVASLAPEDDAPGVAVDANLVITFSETVQKGTGDIVLKRSSDDSVVETIPVTSAAVTVTDATATIDPATTLAESMGYYVEVAAGALEDLASHDFAGISGATAWNFTIGNFTVPTVVRLVPADDATGVALGTDLLITFSEIVQKDSGTIVLTRSSDDWVVERILVASGAVTVAGATVTIDPAATLETNTGYYVEVPAGAFEDLGGLDFAGISGATAWNFTTTDVPPLVVTGTTPELTGTLLPPSTIDVTFNKPIDPATFGTGDVALLDLDDLEVSWAGSFGGAIFDCFIDGPLLYATTTAGLQIFDVSNPAEITRLGGYDEAGSEGKVQVVGDLAYVPDGSAGLQILDVSDPGAVTSLGGYDTSGTAVAVHVVGSRAYVADQSAGLQILDVSSPAAVVRLGGYDTSGSAEDVQVVGDLAYVADGNRGLQILNVADPDAVTEVDRYGTLQSATAVHVVGNVAYMTVSYEGLYILDVSNPAAVTRLGLYDIPGDAREVQVVGNVAYVAEGFYGLEILNVADPDAVTRLDYYIPPGCYGVQVVDDVAYLAGGYDGLHVLNVSNPPAPTALGEYPALSSPGAIEVVGNLAYVVDALAGLQILDVSNPAVVSSLGGYDTTSARDVQVVGDVAYVADDYAGLKILGVSDPAAVTLLGEYDTPGWANAVQVVGSLAYVADGSVGLQIFDVSSPATVTPLGGYDTTSARDVQVVGNVAYVADDSAGLQILDVSDPAAVTLLGAYDTPGWAYGVQVVGSLAYVADYQGGLQILDVSNPAAVTLLGAYATSSYALAVQVVGDLAYIGADCEVLDVSDPAAVTSLGGYGEPGYARDVHVAGNLVYYAAGQIKILEVGSPAAAISHVAGNTYRVDLGRTLPDGEYALLLGPEILDTGGAAMDQDQDGTPREASDDVFFARFHVDAPPTVTNVWVRGSGWTTTFLNYLPASGLGHATHGYAVPVGSSDQLVTLPWFNVDTIAIEFSENVDVDKADLSLWGVTVEQYDFAADPAGFAYDGTSHVGTWTLDQPIDQPDKLLIDLDGDPGGVTDAAAILLDGDWADGIDDYPSGDGTAGGDFRFRFNVVPGDADRDTETRTPDWRLVRSYGGARTGDADYSIFLDVDGDAEIRTPDWRAARAEGGNRLPPGEPAPPPSAPASAMSGAPGSRPLLVLVMDGQPSGLVPPGLPTEPITNEDDEDTLSPPSEPITPEPDPTDEDGLQADDVAMIDQYDDPALLTSDTTVDVLDPIPIDDPVWEEALLLVAQELNDRDDDGEEEVPEVLLPDLLALAPD